MDDEPFHLDDLSDINFEDEEDLDEGTLDDLDLEEDSEEDVDEDEDLEDVVDDGDDNDEADEDPVPDEPKGKPEPVVNAIEGYARASMEIEREIVNTKEELLASELIPEIAFGEYSTPDASQWTLHDMVRRRRADVREGAGTSLTALFYGYPRDIEVRPPVLIAPGRPVYKVSKDEPPSEERWAQARQQWTRGVQSSMKARNDRLAKELRDKLVIDGRDTDMLFFLWRFRNTPPIIISYLIDVPVTQVLARLRQLERAGWVVESGTMGGPLFSISTFGARSLGVSPLPLKEPSQQSFNHNTVVSMIAAMSERGEYNPFHEGDPVPAMRPPFQKWDDKSVYAPGAWGGPAVESDLVDGLRLGFRCISELELRSAWSKWTKGHDFSQEQSYRAAKSELDSWDGKGLAPELRVGNEHLLFLQSGLTYEEHAPDLVVKLPRNPDGTPRSLCVEVEMKAKKDGADYYQQKFSDILSSGRYGEVHYFCPSASVALHVKRGADAAIGSGVPGEIYVHEVVPTFGGREFFWRRG